MSLIPDFTILSVFSLRWSDILTLIPVCIILVVLFRLSNREMTVSQEHQKALGEALIKEREAFNMPSGLSAQELRETRLARMNELAKAAEFGRLSQGLFHDLITPLTYVMLYTEKTQDPKALAAAQKMTAYIRDIRSTLAHEEIDKTFSIRHELDGVLALYHYRLREKNIGLEIVGDGPFEHHGNTLKVNQIFLNLISNAIDSFDGIERWQKKITITIAEANGYVMIKVADNGCGIAQGNLEKIFTPFYTTKSIDKGIGIGLATVKSVVEKDLGGTIIVKSDTHGTSFKIEFPVQTISS